MKKSFTAIEGVIVAAIIIIIIVITFVQPYFEMQSFNKFTKGPKATYWDAVFSELRIEANRIGE